MHRSIKNSYSDLILRVCNSLSALSYRTTFSEFAVKYGRDPRFKTIEKMKDREAIFVEFMTAMRKREKEDSKTRGEKVSLSTYTMLLPFLLFLFLTQNVCFVPRSGKTSSTF